MILFHFPRRAADGLSSSSGGILKSTAHTQLKGFTLLTYSVFLFLFCVVVFVTPLKTTTSICHLLLYLLFLFFFYPIIFDTGRPASRSSAWLNKKKKTNAIVPFITPTCHSQEFRRDCSSQHVRTIQ